MFSIDPDASAVLIFFLEIPVKFKQFQCSCTGVDRELQIHMHGGG